LSAVASAALPVAIGLLVCAAAARAVLWTGFDDADLQRLAREYLDPVGTWGLGAVGVYLFARTAADGMSIGTFFVASVLAAALLAVWRLQEEEATVEEEPIAHDEPTLESEAAADPAPQGRLWSRGPVES
jgi:hypothetical protein